jgi:hypothetical protein
MASIKVIIDNTGYEDIQDDAEDAPASHIQNDAPEITKEAKSNTKTSSSEQTYAPDKGSSIRVQKSHLLQ